MTSPLHLTRFAVVVARIGNAAFALLTATYCLLTYSPFAYEQFIKPHLINALSSLPVWHHAAFWAMTGVTAITMIRELPSCRGRFVGWSYLTVSTLVGVGLLVSPVLPAVENDGRGLVLAVAALVSPIWLAWYDHLVTSDSAVPVTTSDRRVLKAFLIAGIVVWAEQTLTIPWRFDQPGEITLTAAATGFGIVTSLGSHLVVFAALPLALVGAMRLLRALHGDGQSEYWLLVLLSAAAATLVARRLVFDAISFRGPAAWVLSVVAAATFALVWSSVARRLGPGAPPESALELWIRPFPGRSRRAAAAALLALGFVGYAAVAEVARFDWDFLIQRLIVLVIWLAAVAYGFRLVSGGGSLSWPSLAAPACVALPLFGMSALVQPRLTHLVGVEGFVPEFVLEGYVAVDPSYGVIRHVLRVPSTTDGEFYAELRDDTDLSGVTLAPVDIDFVRPLHPQPGAPHIVLLVVDSLRRDYLSPYNPAVRFTPSIERFAQDSFVFERTFARYGGTGLAMPALWTGGLVMPRQYVTPYGPMNTLEKLLDANGYRRVLSVDHITAQIVKKPVASIELDRGRPEMQYDLCTTLDEVSGLPRATWAEAPLFVHTRSLNLHIAHVRKTPVPEGASYPGFMAPVAASIERMDACFGAFVRHLGDTGLYDETIIVVTSDHGDSLGMSLRWGHSYTMFPEVVRIPLIIRVPPRLRDRFSADLETISFSTDITPTLYALLGYDPADLGPLFGRALVGPEGIDLSRRGRDPHLLASSYGPVYDVVRDNGRYLYIADAINNRDYAYEMTDSGRARIGVTPEQREQNRAFIRQQLAELARAYRFELP